MYEPLFNSGSQARFNLQERHTTFQHAHLSSITLFILPPLIKMQYTSVFVTLALAGFAAASPLAENDGLFSRNPPGEKIPCITTHAGRRTTANGDGNPHQNFVFKQVSGTTDCTNNPSGSASITNSQTITYTESISLAVDFITAGFNVAEGTTTGYSNAFGCSTNGGGTITGDLCVFQRIQLTAYTVNGADCFSSSCGGSWCGEKGENVVIYAPNTEQAECFYDNQQLNLPCLGLGTEHQVWAGPAGGPQFIGCQPAFPPAAP